MNQNKAKTILGFMAFLWVAHSVEAMPDDKYKVMHLTADSVSLDQATHKGNYLGQVTLDQGTTHLRAETAETLTDANNTLIQATARGSKAMKAHIWTQTALDKPVLHAFAHEIRFYPNKQYVELIGEAIVQQGGDVFSAPYIHYDTKTQRVITQATGKERTKIIIKNGKLQ